MNEDCTVNLAFNYDIGGTKRGVSMSTPEVDSKFRGVGQKLRVLADKYVNPMEKSWGEIMEQLRKEVPDEMNWEEPKPITVYAVVDGVELVHTSSRCKPREFPQALHELVLRLADCTEEMYFNLTHDDMEKIDSGKTLRKGDMDIIGYKPDDE